MLPQPTVCGSNDNLPWLGYPLDAWHPWAQGWKWEDLVTAYGGHKAGYVSTDMGASLDIKVPCPNAVTVALGGCESHIVLHAVGYAQHAV